MSIKIVTGDCIEVMSGMEPESVDAIVTDPPAGISFMGKTWDHDKGGRDHWIAWMQTVAAECLRVLKPGGHALVWALPRTSHWTATAWENAGFTVRDRVIHIFGCLDEATQVATATGVMPYHKTKIGDLVLCYDRANAEYSYQPILDIVEYDYADTAYRLVGDFGEQVVSRNHRCLVERDGVEIFQLAETLQREARIPVLESLQALRQALHDARQGAGDSEPDVQRAMHVCANQPSEDRDDEAAFGAQGQSDRLRGLWQGGLEDERQSASCQEADMQYAVQRGVPRRGLGEARTQSQGRMVTGGGSCVASSDEGSVEPGLERWTDLHEPQGRIRKPVDQVCALPGGAARHGPGRWLRDGAPAARGSSNGSDVDAIRVGSPHQPRRDGQQAEESDAVPNERGAQGVRAWSGHRTALVRVVPFHYTGKVWCLRVPTGAFVAVRNGVAFPTGNSGFPKSLDVSKAIDKHGPPGQVPFAEFAAHYEDRRKAAGLTHAQVCAAGAWHGTVNHGGSSVNWANGYGMPTVEQWEVLQPLLGLGDQWAVRVEREQYDREVVAQRFRVRRDSTVNIAGASEGAYDITAPGSEAARQWQGWGTALKPAAEDFWLLRKPFPKGYTVAQNVLEFGTGGLNIDGCRVATNGERPSGSGDRRSGAIYAQDEWTRTQMANGGNETSPLGRWPANVCTDGSDEVLAAFPFVEGPWGGNGSKSACGTSSMFGIGDNPDNERYKGSGSAARFFHNTREGESRGSDLGRWPANVTHDGSDEVLAAFPDANGQQGKSSDSQRTQANCYGSNTDNGKEYQPRGDTGSAARFFYTAKASSFDRNDGTRELMTWEHADLNQLTEALRQLQRGTSDVSMLLLDAPGWSTTSCGSVSEARSLQAIRSTIETESKPTTESTTSNCSPRWNTSESIRAAIAIARASGSSLAELAEFISQSRAATTCAKMESALDAGHALFAMLSEASKSGRRGNIHSTVKPTELMRWLCRLITPPDGLILDPFCGSGSTLKAAEIEGFSAIGIECDPAYVEIARRRIASDIPLFAEIAA